MRVRLRRHALGLQCAGWVLLALLLALTPPALRELTSLCLLARLTNNHALDGVAEHVLYPVETHSLELNVSGRALRAVRYTPVGAAFPTPAVLLLHGVHPKGIDEPRLRQFARALAAGGLDVLTPELPDLLAYHLGGASVARIAQLAQLDARQTHTSAVGVIGISFAGGLSLLAAADQAGSRPIGFVVAVGAHDDLLRVARFYAGQAVRGPDGLPVSVAPHPYGARVMIRENLKRLFGASDLPLARRALDAYLRDQHTRARELARGLSADGRQTMDVVLAPGQSRPLIALMLLAVDAARPQLMAASPHGKLGHLQVPVFLIHGQSDPVIPSIETKWLANELPHAWLRQAVITPLLRHAEFPKAVDVSDALELARFLNGIYAQAGSAALAVGARVGDGGREPGPLRALVGSGSTAHAAASLRMRARP